jgi:hypothetical protein
MPKSVLAAFVTSILAWPLGHLPRPLVWLNTRNNDPLPEWGDARCRAAAQGEAYRHLTWIQEQLAGEFTEPALRRMFERDKWFLRNRELLPGEFARHWLSIKDDLQLMLFGETTGNRSPEIMQSVAARVQQTVVIAIRNIEDGYLPGTRRLG